MHRPRPLQGRGPLMEASMKERNWVAKHCRTFNKAVTHRDRKKALKRGVVKHKPRHWDA